MPYFINFVNNKNKNTSTSTSTRFDNKTERNNFIYSIWVQTCEIDHFFHLLD